MRKYEKVHMHIARAHELLQQNDNLSFGESKKGKIEKTQVKQPKGVWRSRNNAYCS